MKFRASDLKSLVNVHGTQVTFTQRSNGAYNTATASSVQTDTAYTVKAYFFDYTLGEVDGDHILYGDRKMVLSLVDTSDVSIPEPSAGDTISGLNDTVRVVSTQKIYSVTPLCYICQVRE